MSTKNSPSLSASNVGEYVFYNQKVLARHDLEIRAGETDPVQRGCILGQLATAPNVIVWHAPGLEGATLDEIQKDRLTKLSTGWSIEAMANAHFVSVRTENRKLEEIYDLLGAHNSDATITAALCLGVLPVERQQEPNNDFTDSELQICRLVGLGLSDVELGRQLGKTVAYKPRGVYRKTGVTSRKPAVRRLFEMGVFWPSSAVVELDQNVQI